MRRLALSAITGSPSSAATVAHGSESRYPFLMSERVAAIELLLREGLGRAPQAEETPTPRLPANAAAVTQMDWHELQMLATTLCADEIASVMNGTNDELLRERLSSLSPDERHALREALAERELV